MLSLRHVLVRCSTRKLCTSGSGPQTSNDRLAARLAERESRKHADAATLSAAEKASATQQQIVAAEKVSATQQQIVAAEKATLSEQIVATAAAHAKNGGEQASKLGSLLGLLRWAFSVLVPATVLRRTQR